MFLRAGLDKGDLRLKWVRPAINLSLGDPRNWRKTILINVETNERDYWSLGFWGVVLLCGSGKKSEGLSIDTVDPNFLMKVP